MLLFYFFMICFVKSLFCLRGGSGVLGEVRGHILLEVEVSQLLILLQLQQLGQRGISLDDTTVVLVLQLVQLPEAGVQAHSLSWQLLYAQDRFRELS